MGLKEIRKVDSTMPLCAKLAETRAFCKDIKGFPLEDDLENWVSFRVGATLLILPAAGTGPGGRE